MQKYDNKVQFFYVINHYIISTIFELEKVELKQVKEKMYQTVISHIKRYRQVPVNFLGFYFWKEVSKDLAKEQIKIWEKEIHTTEDALKYTQDQLVIKIIWLK